MIDWLTRFLMHVILFVVTILILLSFAIGWYSVYAGLHPSRTNEQAARTYMMSEYPHLKPWLRALEKNRELCDTTILSADSVPLHAYYIRAKHPTPNTAVVIHGHRVCAMDMMHIAYMFQHDMNFNVLLPELRTHGRSGGTHIQMGWNDRHDIQLWLKQLPTVFGNDLRVVIHGISMGAATTMMVSGDPTPDYVKCFIEDCGYTSVWDEFTYVAHRDFHAPQFPFIYIGDQICKWQYGWSYREASALEQVKRSTKPMLFIHGTEDRYVPTRMVYELYKAKPRDKVIWEAPDSRHARAYHDHPEEYTRQVKAFVKSYFYK